MGFRFRKSISMGPVRLNFSKSGIGYSAGVKGFRVTKTANGRIRKTTSLQGTGVSYVSESSAKSKYSKATNRESENDYENYGRYEDKEDSGGFDVSTSENQDFKQPRKKHPKLKIAAFIFVALLTLGACFAGDGKRLKQ